MPTTYTVKDVAKILGFSTNSIYAFLKAGRIQGVRMGKGRFRIPAEELARVMHLSKNPQHIAVTEPVGVVSPQAQQVIAPEQILADIPPSPAIIAVQQAPDSVSFFDWFVIGVSLLTSLLLYIYSVDLQIWTGNLKMIFSVLSVILAGAGIGLALVDLRLGIQSAWRYPIMGIIVVCFGSIAAANMYAGSTIFSWLIIMLSVSVSMHMVFRLRPMVSMAMFTVTVAMAYPLSIYISPSALFLPILDGRLLPIRGIMMTVIALIWAGAASIAWAVRNRSGLLSGVLFSILSLILMGASIYHAQVLQWGTALFIVFTAFALAVVPYWDSIRWTHGRDALGSIGLYGLILFVFICGILLLRFVQTSARQRAHESLVTKTAMAEQIISEQFHVNREAVKNLAGNVAFSEAMEASKSDALNAFTQSAFAGARGVVKIQVLNKTGDELVGYPAGSDEQGTNYALRDFFSITLSQNAPFTSSVFVSRELPDKKIIVVATPVRNAAKVTIGVLAAWIDIDSFDIALHKIADRESGEYFTVDDDKGAPLVSNDLPVLFAPETMRYGKNPNVSGVLTVTKIISDLHWVLRANVSLPKVMSTVRGSGIIIGGMYIISLLLLVAGGYFMQVRKHTLITHTTQPGSG